MSRLGDVLGVLRVAGPGGMRRLLANSNALKRYVRPYAVIDCLVGLEQAGLLDRLRSADGVAADSPGFDRYILKTVLEYLFENDLLSRRDGGLYTVRNPRKFEATMDAVYACMAYRDPGHAISRLLGGRFRYGRDVARSDKYDAIASATLTSKFSYKFARNLIEASGAQSVLDVGCGTGQFLGYLAENGFRGKLYGVDQAEEPIAEGTAAQERHPNVHLFVGDALKLKADAKRNGVAGVDLVSFMFVMHEFGDDLVKAVVAGISEAFPKARILLTELVDRSSDELRRTRETTVFPELKLVHLLSNQVLRDRAGWVALLAGCGYRLTAERRNTTANHIGLLFARAEEAPPVAAAGPVRAKAAPDRVKRAPDRTKAAPRAKAVPARTKAAPANAAPARARTRGRP